MPYDREVRLIQWLVNFVQVVFDPPLAPRVELTQEHKDEITAAIRKQRFRGDLAGRQEYQDWPR